MMQVDLFVSLLNTNIKYYSLVKKATLINILRACNGDYCLSIMSI